MRSSNVRAVAGWLTVAIAGSCGAAPQSLPIPPIPPLVIPHHTERGAVGAAQSSDDRLFGLLDEYHRCSIIEADLVKNSHQPSWIDLVAAHDRAARVSLARLIYTWPAAREADFVSAQAALRQLGEFLADTQVMIIPD